MSPKHTESSSKLTQRQRLAASGLNPEAIPALRLAAAWAEAVLSDVEPPVDAEPAGEWEAGLSALRAALAAVRGSAPHRCDTATKRVGFITTGANENTQGLAWSPEFHSTKPSKGGI